LPDPARIDQRLQALWDIAIGPGGGADRPAYSGAEAAAMLLVAGWAENAGLTPAVDEFGNLWALPAEGSGPVVTAGSHVDTVPDGGRYDGALGTVLGLELVSDLADSPVDCGLLVCAAEEAPRFGAGTIGSRLLVGSLPESALDELHDAAGVSAAAARRDYLAALGALPRAEPPIDRVQAHAEVHVAQRRELRELGVVRRVASPRRFEIRITGESGHSGEISMEARRDALTAAAELVLAIEAAARAEPAETVATVGALEVLPGAVSVIPGRARLTVDARGVSGSSLDHLEAEIRYRTETIAGQRGVGSEIELLRAGDPVELDTGLADIALAAAQARGIPARETWSGAGHDAQHLAALMPTLLLFVPLHGGESHTPAEGANIDEIVQAAAVAADALLTAGARCERTVSSAWATRRP
jgi:N-carbamoyl-L-amino-acid hydrolase